VSRPAPTKRIRVKQRRLSPDDRRREIVAKATEFFSEEGFGGGTRALARRLGVTQPPLSRYLPSTDDLIKEVYRTVYLDPLETGWEKLLSDHARPLRDRLQEFYVAYTDAIFTRKWLRIYLYAGLKGLDINRWYVGMVKVKILTRIGPRRQGANDRRCAGCFSRRIRVDIGQPGRSSPNSVEGDRIDRSTIFRRFPRDTSRRSRLRSLVPRHRG
jgi:AcrR family transcriptional regulator